MIPELSVIQEIITQNPDLNCRISADRIQPQMGFRVDLGLDSLGMMSLLYELQDRFPKIQEEAVKSWLKVSDCMKTISESRP